MLWVLVFRAIPRYTSPGFRLDLNVNVASLYPLLNAALLALLALLAVYNLRLRRKLKRALQNQFQTLGTIAHYFPDPMLVVNERGDIIAYSPSACELLQYQPAQLEGLSVEQLMPRDFAQKHHQLRNGFMAGKPGQAMNNEVTCVSATGEHIPSITHVRSFELGDQHLAVVSIQDLRVFKNRESVLRNLSEKDPLTGLANRRLFDHDFSREWQRAMRSKTNLSVLMVDVDAFKQYNDYYGHPAGDECLQQIAAVLLKTVQRATDTVARFGGEEFICVMPDLKEEDVARLAELVRSNIEAENIAHSQSPIADHITVSIGYASAVPKINSRAMDLIGRADAALYQAKAAGRNCVRAAP